MRKNFINIPKKDLKLWVNGTVGIKSVKKENKEIFVVYSEKKETVRINREFSNKRSAKKFYKRITALKKYEQDGCRSCGNPTVPGDDYCKDCM
jgi:hypothetical protein